MFNIGPAELILIIIVALVVVGPKKLPEMGRALGNGLKEFKRASREIREQLDPGLEVTEEEKAVVSKEKK